MVTYPDRGAGNDPNLFFWGGGEGGSVSPPRLNIFTVGNMGVMICLGQGGLRQGGQCSFVDTLSQNQCVGISWKLTHL